MQILPSAVQRAHRSRTACCRHPPKCINGCDNSYVNTVILHIRILQIEHHVHMKLVVLNDQYICGSIHILNDKNCSKYY